MKSLFFVVGIFLMGMAALATPISVVYGIYEWAVVDTQFKVALWEAAKTWVSMLVLLIPGFILFSLGKKNRFKSIFFLSVKNI